MQARFETVDVFTTQRFGGNPLAVFTDARGIDDDTMQALAAEMNYSETTFVLPPADPKNTARVRIFNRTHEMPFAGHPMVGTAFVLARQDGFAGDDVRFEIPAGIAKVALQRDDQRKLVGAVVEAPQMLAVGMEIPHLVVADCLGLETGDVVTANHVPLIASVGNDYVLAQVCDGALARCAPNIAAFRGAVANRPILGGRFSILVYARDGDQIHARMFAPLAGTWEDPATGSANAPLAGLLLSLGSDQAAEFTVRQGAEMGRPSVLRLTATRSARGIVTTVAGDCVPVFSGSIQL